MHLGVLAPVHGLRWVTVALDDDPLAQPGARRAVDEETVIIKPEVDTEGGLTFRIDVQLENN